MQPEILLQAASPIPTHAFLAIFAILIGVIQLIAPKGTLSHRILGSLWVLSMLIVAISSFFINELRMIGPFSIVHLISIYVLYGLYNGIMAARKGDIKKHQKTMRGLYFWGLILAGTFTLLPGRIMYNVLFS